MMLMFSGLEFNMINALTITSRGYCKGCATSLLVHNPRDIKYDHRVHF